MGLVKSEGEWMIEETMKCEDDQMLVCCNVHAVKE